MNDPEPRFNWSAENSVSLDFGRGWLFGSAKKLLVNILPPLRLPLGDFYCLCRERAPLGGRVCPMPAAFLLLCLLLVFRLELMLSLIL